MIPHDVGALGHQQPHGHDIFCSYLKGRSDTWAQIGRDHLKPISGILQHHATCPRHMPQQFPSLVFNVSALQFKSSGACFDYFLREGRNLAPG